MLQKLDAVKALLVSVTKWSLRQHHELEITSSAKNPQLLWHLAEDLQLC